MCKLESLTPRKRTWSERRTISETDSYRLRETYASCSSAKDHSPGSVQKVCCNTQEITRSVIPFPPASGCAAVAVQWPSWLWPLVVAVKESGPG